jgi:thioredoxin reductase
MQSYFATFDVLILGGGVAGVSCALVLGSAHQKPFVFSKNIGILTHQKATALQEGLYNNAYGIPPGTLGADLMHSSLTHLSTQYPHIINIPNEKALEIQGDVGHFVVKTNKQTLHAKLLVVAIGSGFPFPIAGLGDFVMPHQKTIATKQRIQLRNVDHLVKPGLYVAGTLAGWRSQLSIAAGSGAAVATDILTFWNDGLHAQSHDSIRKPRV